MQLTRRYRGLCVAATTIFPGFKFAYLAESRFQEWRVY